MSQFLCPVIEETGWLGEKVLNKYRDLMVENHSSLKKVSEEIGTYAIYNTEIIIYNQLQVQWYQSTQDFNHSKMS